MPHVISAQQFRIEKGKIEGETAILLRLIDWKYGQQALADYRERVGQADAESLTE